MGLKNEKLAYHRNKIMKQRGNLDFDFVNPIECVVLILVYKPLHQKKKKKKKKKISFKSAIQHWFLLKKTFVS